MVLSGFKKLRRRSKDSGNTEVSEEQRMVFPPRSRRWSDVLWKRKGSEIEVIEGRRASFPQRRDSLRESLMLVDRGRGDEIAGLSGSMTVEGYVPPAETARQIPDVRSPHSSDGCKSAMTNVWQIKAEYLLQKRIQAPWLDWAKPAAKKKSFFERLIS